MSVGAMKPATEVMPSVLSLATALLVLFNSETASSECSQDYQCSPPSELCCDGACTSWMKCKPRRCISDEYCELPKYCDKSTYRCTEETIAFPEICRRDNECLESEHCNLSTGKCVAGRRVSTEKHPDVEDQRFTGFMIALAVGAVVIILCIVGYFCHRQKSRHLSSCRNSTVQCHFGDSAQQSVSFGHNVRGNETANVGVSGPPPCYSQASELPSSPLSYEEVTETTN